MRALIKLNFSYLFLIFIFQLNKRLAIYYHKSVIADREPLDPEYLSGCLIRRLFNCWIYCITFLSLFTFDLFFTIFHPLLKNQLGEHIHMIPYFLDLLIGKLGVIQKFFYSFYAKHDLLYFL